MKIYLDVCCLNRPFDDQTQARIRLETEAILSTLRRMEEGIDILYKSDAVLVELAQMPDQRKYQNIERILGRIHSQHISYNDQIILKAKKLYEKGFGKMDALHISCATVENVDIFLTTDDKILRTYEKNRDVLQIRIENPVKWVQSWE